jgi:phage regulator Rha-like protein
MNEISPIEVIQQKIFLIREHKVMLDTDLADLYGVTVKRLNEQVKRNVNRFPQDFMFQLSEEENLSLRSHFATLKIGRGHHRKYLPYVFTEHGTIMLANVLNSPTSVQASIQVVRAFVKLRQILSTHKELANKFNELERKIEKHDGEIRMIFDAIRALMSPPETKKKGPIGFRGGK